MEMTTIAPIRAFKDKYIWCIRRGARAAVVDPGDAGPVFDYLRAEGLQLKQYLIPITTPITSEATPICCRSITYRYSGRRARTFRPSRKSSRKATNLMCRASACGHAYPTFQATRRVTSPLYGDGVLFCGDTLFSCGCGRLFQGTPAQMHTSLSKLADLPPETQIYCGHEDTLANLRFADAAEPGNPALVERRIAARAALDRGRPSLPSTIAIERATNPFRRVHEATLATSASRHAGRTLTNPVEVFAALRKWKDEF